MNEKITMQDIIEQVTKKHGMSRKDAETFVRGMFELIEEALDTENYVKIKGLGTFKLTEVDSRESVNVNTGERIEIQGHTKITFTPDTTMKDQINKPFAHFETVILNEGTRTEDMEAEVLNVEEPQQPIVEEVIPQAEPTVEATPEAVEEIVAPMEEKEEPQITETEEVLIQAPKEVQAAGEEEQSEEKEEHKTPWGIIFAVILILCLAVGIYWFVQSTPKEPQVETTVVEMLSEEMRVQPQDTIIQEVTTTDSIVVETSTPKAERPEAPKAVLNDTIEYEITGTKTTLVLQPGETLVKLALRFYGTKGLWNYIVEYNKDVITDADVVPVGTTLRIPELSPKK